MSLQFNGITNESLRLLCPALKPFANITALDLAANSVVLTLNETMPPVVVELAEALESLPRLQRLNLSGIQMQECVSLILGRITCPLSMLQLSGCGLCRADLQWLSTADVTSRLEQLDVGSNDIARNVNVLCTLLNHTSDSLAVFEAGYADLTEVSLSVLLATFKHLPQLRYVNVCGSDDIGATAIIDALEQLISVPRLRVFRLSAPNDLPVSPEDDAAEANDGENGNEFRDAQIDFAWRLIDQLARLCHAHSRPLIRLVFEL